MVIITTKEKYNAQPKFGKVFTLFIICIILTFYSPQTSSDSDLEKKKIKKEILGNVKTFSRLVGGVFFGFTTYQPSLGYLILKQVFFKQVYGFK